MLKPLTVWITRNYESHSVVSDSLQPHGLCSLWNSLGQNTGVVSLSLLQGIFPTQGSNPGLPHCRQILYQLSHQGSSCLPKKASMTFPPSKRGVEHLPVTKCLEVPGRSTEAPCPFSRVLPHASLPPGCSLVSLKQTVNSKCFLEFCELL